MQAFKRNFPYANVPNIVTTDCAANLTNLRIVYYQESVIGRCGWRGTITAANNCRIAVEYDNKVTQSYRLDALANVNINNKPNAFAHRPVPGYLFITSLNSPHLDYPATEPTIEDYNMFDDTAENEIDQHRYFVKGEINYTIHEVYGENMAKEKARSLAAKSESGQAYIVYKAAYRYEREATPVKETDLRSEPYTDNDTYINK